MTARTLWLALMSLSVLCLASLPSLAADDAIQWRSDYDEARRVAHQKAMPLVIVVGSEECIYCRKQDATTFRDPALIALLNKEALAVKVNGTKEAAFVQALKIQIYPTTIIASPDGKIVSFLQGYITAEQLRDHVRGAIIESVATPDWATRDFAEGEKALRLGDAARAVALWKTIQTSVVESPLRSKAEKAIEAVEKQASDRLARAGQLEAKRELAPAVEIYAEVIRHFSGTKAATEATTKLMTFAARGENVDRLREAVAKEFLTAAKEDFRRERYADCLDHCEQIRTQFPDLPEAKESGSIRDTIQSEPEKLQIVADQLQLRAAETQVLLAEMWLKKNQPERAAAGFEKALLLAPNSRLGELATTRLSHLRAPGVPAMTTGLRKNP
jgi:thioredoxin-related protein